MAFNLNSNQGPAPAPGAGGFSFGSTVAPTSATPATTSATLGLAPPAASFPSFGNTATSAPAASTTTPGLSFGTAPAAAAAPTPGAPGAAPPSTTNAPTPGAPVAGPAATGGFNFGGTPAAPAASTTTTPAAAAAAPGPSTGFAFGGTPAPSATTPAPGAGAASTSGFSFGNTPAPASVPGNTTAGTPAAAAPLPPGEQPALEAPEFDSVFKNLELWSQIQKLVNQDSLMAGQELCHCVKSHLPDFKPQLLEFTPPNQQLRQQLAAKRTVSVNKGGTTFLSPRVLERIVDLSNELHISEAQATTLYAQISNDLEAIQSIPMGDLVDQGMGTSKKYATTTKVAREFYFYERHLRLQTLLFMMQSRLKDDTPNSPIIQATDLLMENGIVLDLIQFIKDYTTRIQQLQTATNPPGPTTYGYQAQPPPQSSTPNFDKVHLLFANQERYVACECLFFIAYHIQLTSSEMASLLDLIKELSRLTPVLSPFTNVPSPYDPASTASTIPTSFPTTSAPVPFNFAVKDKDPLVWQRELVAETFVTGVPQVLQSISLLVVAAIAAMETRQVLYDRKIHGPNAFGTGNAFLPPNDLSLDGIMELQLRLNPDMSKAWGKRNDMFGVLSGSYALLLRSASILLSSPRSGGQNDLTSEIRSAAKYCLIAPAAEEGQNGISFSRLTLVPILQRLPASRQSLVDTSEFGLSIYSDFFSHYVNTIAESTLPLSRRRWEKSEEDDLKIRRDQLNAALMAEQQFGAPFNRRAQADVVPASVDLMLRPDCLDDMISLASTLCSLGPDYSRKFWSTDANQDIQPSRFLLEVERMQRKDDSLLASYVSFLASLSSDSRSASAVHELLSRRPEISADGAATSAPLNWTTLLHNLRWYAQELSLYDNDAVSKPASSSTTTSSTRNSDYYYNLDGQDVPSSYTTSSVTTYTPGQASSTSTRSKAKELSTSANFRVASHLAVIMNVALHSAVAQYGVLSTSIPIGDGVAVGKDEALLVLFKLAIAPLSPQLRGATLSTISSLLRPLDLEDKEKQTFFHEQATNAWAYLEACPLLPIALLDQYNISNGNFAAENVGLGFPPSSISLANSQSSALQSILPKDQRYGLIYSMEHIEARMGWYPSIEGFLQMLRSLVCAVGCPSKLGQEYRVRSGCAPYMEFVIDLVLPRAFGLRSSPRLPFRTYGDQSRLVTHAMSVVEAVVVRYSVPCDALRIKDDTSSTALLGIQSVNDTVVIPDSTTNNQESSKDFRNLSMSTLKAPDIADGAPMALPSRSSTSDLRVPSVKSPGFIVLSDILSSIGGVILQAIGTVLTENGGPDATGLYGQQSDMMEIAYATFGATPPNMSSAKEGSNQRDHSSHLQSLLKPLLPRTEIAILDDYNLGDATYWREKSVVLALRILCAAATREKAFVDAVASSKTPLKIVPVLRFQSIRSNSSNLACYDVLPTQLSKSLFSMEHSELIRKTLVEYIGYNTSSDGRNSSLSATAMSLFFFLHQSMPPSYTLRELCGNDPDSSLARAVAQRLVLSSKVPDSEPDSETTAFILNWILSDLREGFVSRDGLTQLLLGLPTEMRGGNWKPGTRKYSGSIIDCFDSILEILKNTDDSNAGVASLCFEVLFRLYDLLKNHTETALRIALYTAERLRSVQFWNTNALLWLSARGSPTLKRAVAVKSLEEANPFILHSVSWLLKGIACEIQMLVGFTSIRNADMVSGIASLLSPQPGECNELLSLFFGPENGIASRLVELTPLEKPAIDSGLCHPPAEALGSAVVALAGPPDVVSGYQQLDPKKVLKNINTTCKPEHHESMRLWSEQYNAVSSWNCAVSHLCQAIYNMIDASLLSIDSLTVCGFDVVGLQANGLTTLLANILSRFTENVSGVAHHGMDSIFISAATSHLGNAVLILADRVTRRATQDAPNAGELLEVASRLSMALIFSAIGEDSAVEAPTRYERTTVLGSALSLLLCSAVPSEPDLTRQYRSGFADAIQALEKLACFKVDSEVSESNSVVAILARNCIGGIIEACGDEADSFENSFVRNGISKNFVVTSLKLVSNLDEQICSLLHTIALQPFGTNMLVDAGICRALQSAANAYNVEEDRVVETLRAGDSGYNKSTIRTPSFLRGHLKLMNSLMASDTMPQKQMSIVALDFLRTLVLYKRVVERLSHNFPAEVDVLRWFLRCFVQAVSLAQPINSHDRHELLNSNGSQAKHIFSGSRLLENGIAMLCQQLWENPMPKELLPTLPQSLEENESKPRSQVVAVEKNTRQTWWDVLDPILVSHAAESEYDFNAPALRNDFGYYGGKQNYNRWTEQKFEYSIAAMDVLSLGITLLKRMDRYDLIDSVSAARGLFKCAFAAESIANRIEAVEFRAANRGSLMDTGVATANGNDELEMEYLKLFGRSMAHNVEDLLIVTYCLALDAKENGRNSSVVRDAIRAAIEQSGIDTKGVGCVSLFEDAENREKLTTTLCTRIKKETEG